MTTRVACPHCGFLNFAISAYCGRCERPLRRAESEVTAAGSTETAPRPETNPSTSSQASRERSQATATPAAGAGLAHRSAAAAAADAYVRTVSPSGTAPAAQEPPLAAPLTSIPPPLPPLTLPAAPPSAPIEIATPRQSKRPKGPNLGDLPDDPDEEVPVQLPSAWQLGVARMIDGAAVIAFGALVFLLEAALRGARFRTTAYGLLDRLAEWASVHGTIIVHAGAGAVVFAVAYSVGSIRRSGQTLGRLATDTVLVRKNGRPFTWPVLVVRTLAALVSAACLGAGFLWAILDPYQRTWHDLLAGTVTVRRYVRVRAPSTAAAKPATALPSQRGAVGGAGGLRR